MENACVWYRYYTYPNFVNDMYTTNHYKCDETNMSLGQIRCFRFCPYCGKKMKIKNNSSLKNNNYHIKAELVD